MDDALDQHFHRAHGGDGHPDPEHCSQCQANSQRPQGELRNLQGQLVGYLYLSPAASDAIVITTTGGTNANSAAIAADGNGGAASSGTSNEDEEAESDKAAEEENEEESSEEADEESNDSTRLTTLSIALSAGATTSAPVGSYVIWQLAPPVQRIRRQPLQHTATRLQPPRLKATTNYGEEEPKPSNEQEGEEKAPEATGADSADETSGAYVRHGSDIREGTEQIQMVACCQVVWRLSREKRGSFEQRFRCIVECCRRSKSIVYGELKSSFVDRPAVAP
ncbi:hypothetical protein B0T16DRAFT_394089 [Cercophora newfieldiana]|uniref:Uncharacterized protein n=1 Tax=Cercophora newfieldiana TaxID=92897 RepID=A0AA40CKK3_9PEZI|nr:hypothetical protein B0T16DRAFT_394089 [Cercophora newfieldiana]